MDNEMVKYRKCSIPGCEYKEIRGSRLGDFITGKFVCPKHFEQFNNERFETKYQTGKN